MQYLFPACLKLNVCFSLFDIINVFLGVVKVQTVAFKSTPYTGGTKQLLSKATSTLEVQTVAF